MGKVITPDFSRGRLNGPVLPALGSKMSVEQILSTARYQGCIDVIFPFITSANFPTGKIEHVREYLTFDHMVTRSQLIGVEFPQRGVRPATAAEMLYDYVINHDVLWHVRLMVALGQLWKNDGQQYAVSIKHRDNACLVEPHHAGPDELFGTLWQYPVVLLDKPAA